MRLTVEVVLADGVNEREPNTFFAISDGIRAGLEKVEEVRIIQSIGIDREEKPQ